MYQANPKVEVLAPLSDIHIQTDWNSRSGDVALETGDPDEHSFAQLVASMREHGQKVPVDVRLSRASSRPLELMAGYRRCVALSTIFPPPEDPQVRVYIHDCSDSEARAINLSENAERLRISDADLAWGLCQLQFASNAEGKRYTIRDIASLSRVDSSKVATLLHIMNNVHADVLYLWRNSPVKVLTDAMSRLARVPRDSQMTEFKRLYADRGRQAKAAARKHRTDWTSKATSQAELLGTALGRLERRGIINTAGLDFREHLSLMIATSKSNQAEQQYISELLNNSYQEAIDGKCE